MKRRAIIIGNPGEKETKDYCKGVFRDVDNYYRFLRQPQGGLWRQTEIDKLGIPTSTAEVFRAIERVRDADYLLVIFSGHGAYSRDTDTTQLEIRPSEPLLDERVFYKRDRKTTIILDCCRTGLLAAINEIVEAALAKVAGLAELDPVKCRLLYDDQIRRCENGTTVLYSCSVEEESYDRRDGTGGVYSHNLLHFAERWVESVRREIDTSKTFKILSVVEAHDVARLRTISRMVETQTPDILCPKSKEHFPFAIVA